MEMRLEVGDGRWLMLLKLRRILWDPLGYKKLFCVPHFLFAGKGLLPPRPSLRFKGQVQTVANQGREGTQKQRRSS